MPTTTHSCISLECDLCGLEYDPEGYSVHFRDLSEARDLVGREGWTITADGQVICALDDADHQAAIKALMPPEPVIQCAGQLGFDGTEEP